MRSFLPPCSFLRGIRARHPGLLAAVLLASAGAGIGSAEEFGEADLAAMRMARDVRILEAMKPLKDLESKYRDAIEKKQTSARLAGDLDGVVAAKAELEVLDSQDDAAALPSQQDLARLRQIYRQQKSKLTPQVEAAMGAANREYVKQLNQTVVELTKAGNTAGALEAREWLNEETKRQQEALAAGKSQADAAGQGPSHSKAARLKLEKTLMTGSWTWHAGGPEAAAAGTLHFLEEGRLSGPSWLTKWEILDGGTFRITFMNQPEKYWIFVMQKDGKSAETNGKGTITDRKVLKAKP